MPTNRFTFIIIQKTGDLHPSKGDTSPVLFLKLPSVSASCLTLLNESISFVPSGHLPLQSEVRRLATRYDGVKGEHDKVAGQIATLISTKTAAQQFIRTLRGLPQKMTAFNPETWGKLLEHATVYTDGSIRFTFRKQRWCTPFAEPCPYT